MSDACVGVGRRSRPLLSIGTPLPSVYPPKARLAASPLRACTREVISTAHLRDLEASGALDVHEERVGLGDDLLELVGSGVNVGRSVEEIDSESLV